MQGDLMLIWGELDRNVDPASTMQVINALVRADKDFEQLIVPGVGHGAAGHPYAKRRQADFFVRKLWNVEPRRPANDSGRRRPLAIIAQSTSPPAIVSMAFSFSLVISDFFKTRAAPSNSTTVAVSRSPKTSDIGSSTDNTQGSGLAHSIAAIFGASMAAIVFDDPSVTSRKSLGGPSPSHSEPG